MTEPSPRLSAEAWALIGLLSLPWAQARLRLTSDDVRAAIIDGRMLDDFVDQPPR